MDIAFLLGVIVWVCGAVWMAASRRRQTARWKAFRDGRLHPGQGMMLGGGVLVAKGFARFIAPSSGEMNELAIGLGIFFLIYITSIRLLGGRPDRGPGPDAIRS